MSETILRSCALSELLPDQCSPVLHSHHVTPISAGGEIDGHQVWVCSKHHPSLEALARRVLNWRSCTHEHRYPGAREACEARLNREALDR